jgi:hypothetical protein
MFKVILVMLALATPVLAKGHGHGHGHTTIHHATHPHMTHNPVHGK